MASSINSSTLYTEKFKCFPSCPDQCDLPQLDMPTKQIGRLLVRSCVSNLVRESFFPSVSIVQTTLILGADLHRRFNNGCTEFVRGREVHALLNNNVRFLQIDIGAANAVLIPAVFLGSMLMLADYTDQMLAPFFVTSLYIV